jgi:predicted HD phosphohydrolase
MIVRRGGAHLLVITQRNHAAPAGRIAEALCTDTRVIEAARLHDIGWQECQMRRPA